MMNVSWVDDEPHVESSVRPSLTGPDVVRAGPAASVRGTYCSRVILRW
jgi:hypothetical protein